LFPATLATWLECQYETRYVSTHALDKSSGRSEYFAESAPTEQLLPVLNQCLKFSLRCCSDYHKGSGHYIDYTDSSGRIQAIGPDVGEETTIDNRNRPGRYIMLQKLEADAADQTRFGAAQMESSLNTARELKARVGDMTWQQFVQSL
jgi:hypothetical protein